MFLYQIETTDVDKNRRIKPFIFFLIPWKQQFSCKRRIYASETKDNFDS